MNPEELYDKYRQCGEAYWLELSSQNREWWEHIAWVVNNEIEDADYKGYSRGHDGGYDEGWNAGEYGD